VTRDDEKRTVAEVLKQNASSLSESVAANSNVARDAEVEEAAAAAADGKKKGTDEAQLLAMTLKNGDFFQACILIGVFCFRSWRVMRKLRQKFRTFRK